MRYFLCLAYNGRNYNGWQVQENAPSIQATLQDALEILFREAIPITGCGRTDTGVHARKFYAHFDFDGHFDQDHLNNSMSKLNGLLPKDIVIMDIIPVKHDAHARFDALSRTYIYQISLEKDPFYHELAYYFVYDTLDINLMNEGAKVLLEYQDFTSFSKVNTQVKTNICRIIKADWTLRNNMMLFTITADRFLRNMVRAIVGTLIDCGRKRIGPGDIRRIIEAKDRSQAGQSAPAHGLFLDNVTYPDSLFLQ